MNRKEIRMKLWCDVYVKARKGHNHGDSALIAASAIEKFDLAFPEQEAKPEPDHTESARKLRNLAEWFDMHKKGRCTGSPAGTEVQEFLRGLAATLNQMPEQDPNRKLRELLQWYDRVDRTVVGGWEVIQHAKELLLEP